MIALTYVVQALGLGLGIGGLIIAARARTW